MEYTRVNLSAKIDPYEVEVMGPGEFMETVTMGDRWRIQIEVTGPKCLEVTREINKTAMKYHCIELEEAGGPESYYRGRNQLFSAWVVLWCLVIGAVFIGLVGLFRLVGLIGGLI